MLLVTRGMSIVLQQFLQHVGPRETSASQSALTRYQHECGSQSDTSQCVRRILKSGGTPVGHTHAPDSDRRQSHIVMPALYLSAPRALLPAGASPFSALCQFEIVEDVSTLDHLGLSTFEKALQRK